MTRVTNDFNTQDDPDSTGGATALEAGSVGNKLINIIMHDAAGGSGGVGSPDSEVYGSIIYNNGWVSPNRGNGHGFYIHNPTSSLFKVVDNLIFNNFGYGLHGFAQNANGFVNNIWMEGNISFNNGSPGTYPGNVANQRPNFRFTNLWVGAEPNGPKNITYKNNYLYSPPGTSVGGGVLSYGYGNAIGDNVKVEGNYISGGIGTFGIGNTLSAMVTGNTVVSSSPSAGEMVQAKAPSSHSYVWDNNRYFAVSPVISGCSGGGDRAVPFIFAGKEGSCGGFLDFNDWKRLTGFDRNSTFTVGRPRRNDVFIRPNKYERGRAHIVVYNWGKDKAITLSAEQIKNQIGLQAGQRYEIRNAQKFLGAPVASGVYDGGAITILLTSPEAMAVATPIGNPGGFTPQSTCPDFCVFVVLPVTPDSSTPRSTQGATPNSPSGRAHSMK